MTETADGRTPVSVVTGGTGVVGSEVGRLLADRGDEVWLVGRDADRGESLATEITEGTAGTARFVRTDLASPDETDELIAAVRERGRLDRFVHAAGAFRRERTTTDEGLEYTFAVNYLSAYRLCRGLVPVMRASGSSRIVTLTASVADKPIDLEDLQSASDYSLQDAYARSKRCLTAFTVELAERLAADADADGQGTADGEADGDVAVRSDGGFDWYDDGADGDGGPGDAGHGGTADADADGADPADANAADPADADAGAPVGVDAVVPGFVPGGRAAKELPAVLRGSFKLLSTLRLGTAPETAAERVLDPLTDDPGPTGRYYDGGEPTDLPSFATDSEVRAELWRRSGDLAGVDPDWP